MSNLKLIHGGKNKVVSIDVGHKKIALRSGRLECGNGENRSNTYRDETFDVEKAIDWNDPKKITPP